MCLPLGCLLCQIMLTFVHIRFRELFRRINDESITMAGIYQVSHVAGRTLVFVHEGRCAELRSTATGKIRETGLD